mmetsp:Transcript_4360/g.18464  ORF Transcript_4360/g.18464 Transcript_4360/m.18464 type:complete len:519 (-) Transcript_4360:856-2412(-)
MACLLAARTRQGRDRLASQQVRHRCPTTRAAGPHLPPAPAPAGGPRPRALEGLAVRRIAHTARNVAAAPAPVGGLGLPREHATEHRPSAGPREHQRPDRQAAAHHHQQRHRKRDRPRVLLAAAAHERVRCHHRPLHPVGGQVQAVQHRHRRVGAQRVRHGRQPEQRRHRPRSQPAAPPRPGVARVAAEHDRRRHAQRRPQTEHRAKNRRLNGERRRGQTLRGHGHRRRQLKHRQHAEHRRHHGRHAGRQRARHLHQSLHAQHRPQRQLQRAPGRAPSSAAVARAARHVATPLGQQPGHLGPGRFRRGFALQPLLPSRCQRRSPQRLPPVLRRRQALHQPEQRKARPAQARGQAPVQQHRHHKQLCRRPGWAPLAPHHRVGEEPGLALRARPTREALPASAARLRPAPARAAALGRGRAPQHSPGVLVGRPEPGQRVVTKPARAHRARPEPGRAQRTARPAAVPGPERAPRLARQHSRHVGARRAGGLEAGAAAGVEHRQRLRHGRPARQRHPLQGAPR